MHHSPVAASQADFVFATANLPKACSKQRSLSRSETRLQRSRHPLLKVFSSSNVSFGNQAAVLHLDDAGLHFCTKDTFHELLSSVLRRIAIALSRLSEKQSNQRVSPEAPMSQIILLLYRLP